MADGSGNSCYQATFTPYGIEYATQTTCSSHYKFTGYERDTETGLDYAYARYYSSRLGRFMSADPMGLGSADPADPQTMNAYAYVRNSPTSLVDPLGMMISLQQEQGWCDVVDCNFQNEIDAGSGGSISNISFFGGSAGVSGVTYFETYFSTPFGECWGMDGGGDLAPCWYWNSQAGSAGSSQSGGGGGAGGGSGKAGPTAPQKPPLSQRAKTYFTQYVPCAMEGFWLGHFLGDKEHTEGFLIANVFVPAGAAAKWGPWGVLVGATSAASYDFKAAIETNQTCTAQVYGSQQ